VLPFDNRWHELVNLHPPAQKYFPIVISMSAQKDQAQALDPGLQTARELALGGLFAALGIALPLAFHAAQLGKVFLPMHFPVLALGLLVRPSIAGTVGAIVPLVSCLLTGMPPLAPPIAVMMSFELGALGTTASLLSYHLHWSPWLSAPVAIVAARVVLGGAVVAVGPLLGFRVPVLTYVIGAIVTGAPGIALQLATMPLLVQWLKRVRSSE